MPKLQSRTLAWIWTISGCLAVLSVLPLMDVCRPCGVFLLMGFVGAVLSAMVSNLHDPNPVLVVLFNWILFALLAIAVAKVRKRRKGEPAA
ncbi:MAG TPA: hypothetical protein VIX90_11295 [Edaphobacter sp.]